MKIRPECEGKIGRQAEICNGTANIPLFEINKYRSLWGLEPIPESEWVGIERGQLASIKKPKKIIHEEKVGTALAKRVERLFEVKSGSGCNCELLSYKMNNWGIDGCEKERDYIVSELIKNSDILGVSLAKAAVSYVAGVGVVESTGTAAKLFTDWWKGNDVTHEAKIAGANWLLSKSIEDVKKKRQNRCRLVNRSHHSPFRASNGEWRFITLEQYATDIRTLLRKVPNDIDCVAGVARSGLYAATMVAMMLHKPMVVVSQTAGHITEAGNGWRLGNFQHITPKMDKVLVIDDTVMTGGSQKRIREVVSKRFKEVVYATVYCNPLATLGKPDIYAVDLQWPHILEWNIFNSIISPSLAIDFDGILCYDCTAKQDDDGELYRDFIKNAEPLYLPRKEPIPLIVTARIEKYRDITEEWLRRHNVRWKNLVMHPASTLAQRNHDDIAAYKAKHFIKWAKANPPAPGPNMFCESDHQQAKRIFEISGLPTICPATATVWH